MLVLKVLRSSGHRQAQPFVLHKHATLRCHNTYRLNIHHHKELIFTCDKRRFSTFFLQEVLKPVRKKIWIIDINSDVIFCSVQTFYWLVHSLTFSIIFHWAINTFYRSKTSFTSLFPSFIPVSFHLFIPLAPTFLTLHIIYFSPCFLSLLGSVIPFFLCFSFNPLHTSLSHGK